MRSFPCQSSFSLHFFPATSQLHPFAPHTRQTALLQTQCRQPGSIQKQRMYVALFVLSIFLIAAPRVCIGCISPTSFCDGHDLMHFEFKVTPNAVSASVSQLVNTTTLLVWKVQPTLALSCCSAATADSLACTVLFTVAPCRSCPRDSLSIGAPPAAAPAIRASCLNCSRSC